MDDIQIPQITTKEERDTLLKTAELEREKGNLEEALAMLNVVKSWDEQNDAQNPKRSAVFGHIRITYSRMGMHEPVLENKKEFYRLALEATDQGLALLESFPQETGLLATMQIHKAGARIDYASTLQEESEHVAELTQALADIEPAIQNLPGSQAHKAWPLRTKVEILRRMHNYEEAVKTALAGIELIYAGYEDEVAKDASAADLKLRVWLSGLQLEIAKCAAEQNKPILASYFAYTVLNTPDETGTLTERKREAESIVSGLN